MQIRCLFAHSQPFQMHQTMSWQRRVLIIRCPDKEQKHSRALDLENENKLIAKNERLWSANEDWKSKDNLKSDKIGREKVWGEGSWCNV